MLSITAILRTNDVLPVTSHNSTDILAEGGVIFPTLSFLKPQIDRVENS